MQRYLLILAAVILAAGLTVFGLATVFGDRFEARYEMLLVGTLALAVILRLVWSLITRGH